MSQQSTYDQKLRASATKDYSLMTQHLLIVEPDPAISTVFVQWLHDMGWEVTAVGDGGEAMHVLRAQSIDGLILDLKAPVMDGLTMLTQLRQRYADIPVIVLATVDMTDVLLEALESGAHDYLTKPTVCSAKRASYVRPNPTTQIKRVQA
jgi:CheY-like chemotaxis protein